MRCTAQVRGLQHRSTRLRLHVELPLERCSQWPVLCDIHSDILLLVNNNKEPSIHWIHSLIPGVSFGKFFALLPLNITLPHSLFSFILGSHCTYVESFYDASLFSYIILCTFHSYHWILIVQSGCFLLGCSPSVIHSSAVSYLRFTSSTKFLSTSPFPLAFMKYSF